MYGYILSVYIQTKGVEPLFIVLILGCREPINWIIGGYAPFCI